MPTITIYLINPIQCPPLRFLMGHKKAYASGYENRIRERNELGILRILARYPPLTRRNDSLRMRSSADEVLSELILVSILRGVSNSIKFFIRTKHFIGGLDLITNTCPYINR